MRRPAIAAADVVAFLDSRSSYHMGGYPRRVRKRINGHLVEATDVRMIRRWRNGEVRGVLLSTASGLLRRYQIDPAELHKVAPPGH